MFSDRPARKIRINPIKDQIRNYLDKHEVNDDLENEAIQLLESWGEYDRGGLKGWGRKLDSAMQSMQQRLQNSKSPAKIIETDVQIVHPETELVVRSFKICYDSGVHAKLHRTTSRFGIFIAKDDKNKLYAVKFPMGQDPAASVAIRECRKEIYAWSRIHHQNVLPFLGVFKWHDVTYMVSPYAENGDLKEFVVKNPSCNVVRLLKEAAEGVAHLHTMTDPAAFVHADIKCENILITANCHAQICDFDQTKLSGTATTTSSQKHTYAYVSPEIYLHAIGSKPATRTFKSDVYAFGMTMAAAFYRTGVIFDLVELNWDRSMYDFVRLRVHRQYTDEAGIQREPYRPPKPEDSQHFCPEDAAAWKVAQACWLHDAASRPDMLEVVRRIEAVMSLFPKTLDTSW